MTDPAVRFLFCLCGKRQFSLGLPFALLNMSGDCDKIISLKDNKVVEAAK